jgi:hypothetical protein
VGCRLGFMAIQKESGWAVSPRVPVNARDETFPGFGGELRDECYTIGRPFMSHSSRNSLLLGVISAEGGEKDGGGNSGINAG